MNVEVLLPAIQDAEPWLERFNVQEYVPAYREYCARFAPLYADAVRDDAPEEVAESLLDALESGWKCQRIWNRSKVRMDEKDMLIRYLSPMLLDHPAQGGDALAAALRDGWNARWPKDAYQIASYAKLRKNFNNSFLGLSFGKREAIGEEE